MNSSEGKALSNGFGALLTGLRALDFGESGAALRAELTAAPHLLELQ